MSKKMIFEKDSNLANEDSGFHKKEIPINSILGKWGTGKWGTGLAI